MSVNQLDEYWVPEHVKNYLTSLGFVLPLDDMEPWIRAWDDWMGARGDFYDYHDTDGLGRSYEVHRRSIHPAMRVCKEWGSLLLNEEVKVVCEDQKASDWINEFFSTTNFMAQAQATVVRAFGLGTGAWALWLDLDHKKVRVRHYDARMVIPLTWDEDGITECSFVTRAIYRGNAIDQLQMHTVSELGTHRIEMVCFDNCGDLIGIKAQAAFRLAELLIDETNAEWGIPYDPVMALHFYQVAEIGMRIQLADDSPRYAERLRQAIAGQDRARAIMDEMGVDLAKRSRMYLA